MTQAFIIWLSLSIGAGIGFCTCGLLVTGSRDRRDDEVHDDLKEFMRHRRNGGTR